MHVPVSARPGPYPRLAYARQDDRARLLFLAPTPCVPGRSPVSATKERTGEPSQVGLARTTRFAVVSDDPSATTLTAARSRRLD
jgi:hypothetical protein